MATSRPLVSIIVPVYNSERYLPYCVESILNQSYTNLEIILVDDGSKDTSPRICDDYAEKDSRVIVIHQKNGGIAKAQNTGLDAAHGEYIAFADNDDILDSRNIELLLHAILNTGADMSKGRWQQFGVSQLAEIKARAAQGSAAPDKTTSFKNPLHAYQTVFCKSLRILGNLLGKNSEALYFNEANWCRLYKRELWDGLRFDLGHYAQDIRMAAPLYSRMKLVTDIDSVLYYWLQEPDSVTHSKRTPNFWHDNVTAAAKNFQATLDQGIVPCRNYFGLVASVKDEEKVLRNSSNEVTDADWQNLQDDLTLSSQLILKLTPLQRLHCYILFIIRHYENKIYDRKIHDMK
ncbi:glycosyl transferase [Bifidobacterium adolescentis]|uniref:Glycosyltransferase 2-like domain-containing protein n=1 Tax=Bifidobacterium adolescentis (strain ATCC 15703 / DSM 20083 / NCTC 11814 / E194a) TaxID=367928 RepID=A1A3J6_BIFAA|nr:glycosyltransferase [Bifidobacterium adolescentis]MCT6789970.1 glycosyltransferase [Bifidobacterium adolescentis]NRD15635.1 glycosyltransferase [Bifidobacterium adolescentis]OSG97067.1 glycosyl transferase [Bifidobacterium adolescentis]SPU23005.1 cell wall membrane glycosyltransferase [Bifidobacterium adolescentis]BAF40279.1 hypothetical protein BAD_1498 [Bifidobacterium adolescentis ATCC 15703]